MIAATLYGVVTLLLPAIFWAALGLEWAQQSRHQRTDAICFVSYASCAIALHAAAITATLDIDTALRFTLFFPIGIWLISAFCGLAYVRRVQR